MAPRKKSKTPTGDATFKPQGDPLSISTLESGDVSPERQKARKRKPEDGTFKPHTEQTSLSSQDSGRGRGRPKKLQKTAAPRAHQQPRVDSESSELRRERGVSINPGMSTANIITGYGSNWSPGLSTTDRLKTFCDFLHVEDPDTHRYFKDECDDIEIFLSNLASSKEMFDVGVYEQVKSMLRVHRERMLEREGDRLMRPLTFKVPSGSTTQSSNEYSIISLDEWRRPSDETEATDRDLDYGDGDTLEFFHTDHERRKRPRTEANESGQKNQGSRRAARQKDKRTAAENDLFTGINCLGEYEYASRGELEPAYEVGWADGERRGSVDRDGELIGGIPKPGSGSLVPPEVAALRADDDRESVGSAEGEEENLDERFYPGDPVFMFGETIFLQALQSRQIENDMAPDDETRSRINERPLMGMFARFGLPKVHREIIEKKPKPRSYCTMS